MDKKSIIIGLTLIIAALALMMYSDRQQKRYLEERKEWETQNAEEQPPQPEASESQQANAESRRTLPNGTATADAAANAVERETSAIPEERETLLRPIEPATEEATADFTEEPEEIYHLTNDFIEVAFTNRGGAIRNVALKQYPLTSDSHLPVVINEGQDLPALAISFGESTVREYAPVYRLVEQTERRIVFAREELPGLELIREYEISDQNEGAEPYLIRHRTLFRNATETAFHIDRIWINVGTAAPEAADRLGWNLNAGFFDGEDHEFFSARDFRARKGFLSIGRREARSSVEYSSRIVWASVKNQFFTSILRPEEPGRMIRMLPIDFFDPILETVDQGIAAAVEFDLDSVQPASDRVLEMQLYVGPKEYPRLDNLPDQQDRVMQFGIFGFFSKILLHSLLGLQSLVVNWGVAIIILTVLIRLLLWPLTAKAARSSKRMAKIQAPLKELREKYKDEPQKMQKATLELFRKHKVNPLSGCIPMLIQIPIFIGFFYMLRSASELRFASFLWIPDLSLPDTISSINGFPVNPLPIVMGITMYFQMRMTPTPTMDPAQQKIFRFMPAIFLIFCYNFSSGLVLYWTMSNLFSIIQQSVTNRQKDVAEELPTVEQRPTTGGTGKPLKRGRKPRP